MHILMTTFGFLLIFALATTGQFRRLISLSIVEKAYQTHFDASKQDLEKISHRRAQKISVHIAPKIVIALSGII